MGLDVRLQTVAEGKGIWRMKSLLDIEYTFDEDVIPPGQVRRFYHRGVLRMQITSRKLVIFAGYAWNGNSPKRGFRFLWRDWWFGTPDFIPETVKSSQFHDDVYQFSSLPELPFTCKQADKFYEQLAHAHGLKLDDTYHFFLRICGNKFWGRADEDLTCEITHEIPDTIYPGCMA